MRLRIYTVSQKYVKNKHGDIGVYKKRIKKWIKSSQPYRPRKRGLQKSSVYSTRFGFLELYNRKGQQELICPSGYSISQCFNVLRKLWYGYRRAIGTDKDTGKMKKYAIAIQNVQKDMGIKTASFPQLGLVGDALILRPKHGFRRVLENRCTLKKKQQEYEIRKAKNAIKIKQALQKPDKLHGETFVTFVDDVSPYEKRHSKVTVPLLLKPDKEKGEEIHTLADNIPFRRPHRRRRNRKHGSTLTVVDNVFPYEKQGYEITVPMLLKPDKEKGEEIHTLVDNIPFRRPHRRRRNRNGNSSLLIPNDEIPDEELEEIPDEESEVEVEDKVPHMLEPEGDEEVLVFSDNIPFRS